MTVSSSSIQVTAVFNATTPFTDWDLLFRDVEAANAAPGCAISLLSTRPSLGPYLVTSASPSLVVLTANPQWPLNYNRFQTIVVKASDTTHAAGEFYVGFSPSVTSNDLGALASHNSYASSFVASPSVLDLAFSPASRIVTSLDARAGLSWALHRSRMLTRIDPTGGAGAAVPTSVLYPATSPLYPPPELAPPVDPTAPQLAGSGLDCFRCVSHTLARAGWRQHGGHWTWRSRPVLLTLGVGPTEMDQRAAAVVAEQWSALGISVRRRYFSTDAGAATATATGVVPCAVYTRPLGSSPWWVMSSFVKVGGVVDYPSGLATPVLAQTLRHVTADFNPQGAQASWEVFDQWLQHEFWLRPLATPPALTLWSGRVGNVQPSSSLAGLVDQVPNWGVAPPHSVPTTTTTVRTS
jgi:ABC-type transport system substrate-binding protein